MQGSASTFKPFHERMCAFKCMFEKGVDLLCIYAQTLLHGMRFEAKNAQINTRVKQFAYNRAASTLMANCREYTHKHA